MKYLKYFLNDVDYQNYIKSDDFIKPNVSYTKDTDSMYYNPHTESVISDNMVDLGLPSGLKWADRNVGAASPEDAGLYFAWGETIGYTAEQVGTDKVFDYANYFDTTDSGSTFTKYNNYGGLTTLEAADDAATVHMGGNWRMPTFDETKELINGTTRTLIDMDGNEIDDSILNFDNIKGVRFTSKTNGNSIFIPAVGHCENTSLHFAGEWGNLWSSSLASSNLNGASTWARCMEFDKYGSISTEYTFRKCGFSVRGVCN